MIAETRTIERNRTLTRECSHRCFTIIVELLWGLNERRFRAYLESLDYWNNRDVLAVCCVGTYCFALGILGDSQMPAKVEVFLDLWTLWERTKSLLNGNFIAICGIEEWKTNNLFRLWFIHNLLRILYTILHGRISLITIPQKPKRSASVNCLPKAVNITDQSILVDIIR